MAAKSATGLMGLETYPSIPPARQRSRSPLIACAVTPTMGRLRSGPGFDFADGGGGGEPVHLRHLHVHEDDVEAPGLRPRQRLPAVVRQHHGVPLLLEDGARQPLVDGVVLGEEDPQPPRGVLDGALCAASSSGPGRARS